MIRSTPLAAATAEDRTLTELRALHALAEAITRCTFLEAIYPETLQALCWAARADRAAVLLFDAGGTMRFVASDGLSDDYCKAVEGHSPWAANETNAQPILVPAPEREPSIAKLLPLLREEGIASLAFIPIAHQGRLLGKFMLYFNEPHEMEANEVRLALTVAEYLALAISRQHAVEEIRRLNAELEDRVQYSNQELAEANREMESFCYSVSHDLRAPLRALDGFARILLEDAGHLLDGTDKDNLRRIIAASGRMGFLMDDLLRLSRIGRAGMRLTETNLDGLAGEIAGRLRSGTPERLASIMIDAGPAARADAGLMRIALENLLGNAWKYTRNKAETRIEFGQREENGRPVYFVRDNGAGFDMRYAAKLFSPFQRVHSPSEFEGNGIGLAIVQRIVHRHGGRIWAESEPGRGSTFCFTLWEAGIPADLQAASSRLSSPPA
ncbi:MAG: GAF domain-containing protein [Betaproteobacteria bacterium]|nr:GAF domain-containing protein [Betaproteobacteria bacterium]